MSIARYTLLPVLLVLVGCHTPQLSLDVATHDGDGYGTPAKVRYPGFGPMEHKLVELNQRSEAVAAAHETLQRRSEELDRDIARYRARLQQVERENVTLRGQLVHRDQLLASYFQRLSRTNGKVPWLRPGKATPTIKSGSLTKRVKTYRERIALLQRENVRLRKQVARRDRVLASRGKTEPQKRTAVDRIAPPDEIPSSKAETTTTIAVASRAKRYHLRIIALPYTPANRARIKQVVAHLSRSGIKQRVYQRRSGNHWVVDVGDFESSRSADARALAHTVRTLRFQGRREFRSAYFTRH